MAKFITIAYGEQAGYDNTDAKVRSAAHAHDADLKARGAIISLAGAPVQVRKPRQQWREHELEVSARSRP